MSGEKRKNEWQPPNLFNHAITSKQPPAQFLKGLYSPIETTIVKKHERPRFLNKRLNRNLLKAFWKYHWVATSQPYKTKQSSRCCVHGLEDQNVDPIRLGKNQLRSWTSCAVSVYCINPQQDDGLIENEFTPGETDKGGADDYNGAKLNRDRK